MGRALGDGSDLGVGVGRGVAVAVAVTVGVGVGEIVAVAVAVGVGLGVVSDMKGATTSTVTGEPVLKKLTVAVLALGGPLESNRKLYNVPQRIALAFWFCANVSALQVMLLMSVVTFHGALLYPASPCVPSCGQPGC